MRRQAPDDVIRNAGRRVAEVRMERGWTQAQLAERLDVSLTYVQRVEGGRANLSLKSLCEVANALRVAVPDLVSPASTPTARPGRPKTNRRR